MTATPRSGKFTGPTPAVGNGKRPSRIGAAVRYVVRGAAWDDARTLRFLAKGGGTDVLFYAKAPMHRLWIASTLAALPGRVRSKVVYARGWTPKDALPEGARLLSPWLLSRARCRAFVTAVSALRRSDMPRSARVRIHMPHSLASLHPSFPEGTFDGFDRLFACGPHHVREAAVVRARRGVGLAADSIGYGILEPIEAALRTAPAGFRPCVLIAPSWGDANVIEAMGPALVRRLLADGNDVIVRPHPMTWRARPPALQEILAMSARQPRLRVESGGSGHGSFAAADVMVSDYSGVAFEFAFTRMRPVVLVDGPLKVKNPQWDQWGVPPIELEARDDIGIVVAPSAEAVADGVKAARRDGQDWATRLAAAKRRHVFHPDGCGQVAAARIVALLEGAA